MSDNYQDWQLPPLSLLDAQEKQRLNLRKVLESLSFAEADAPNVVLGVSEAGETKYIDVSRQQHLFIFGSSNTGKTNLLRVILAGLLRQKTPDELKVIVITKNRLDFLDYEGIPHLLTLVVSDSYAVARTLDWLEQDATNREKILAQDQVRNISEYLAMHGTISMPFIFVLIDGLSNFLDENQKHLVSKIAKTIAIAKHVGINFIVTNQDPTSKSLSTELKNLIPTRLSFQLPSRDDSEMALGVKGAEELEGNEALFKDPVSRDPVRINIPLVGREEERRLLNFIKAQIPEVKHSSVLEPTNA